MNVPREGGDKVDLILSLGLIFVLVLIFLTVGSALNALATFVYQIVYKAVLYILEPAKIIGRWLVRKWPDLKKPMDWFQNTRKGNVMTIVLVAVMFVLSVGYLLYEGIKSGDLRFFLGDEFASAMPVASLIMMLIGQVSIPQVMAETTMTGLCLYYVNKNIDGANVGARILYSLAFVFIGWTVGRLVSTVIFQPVFWLLDNCWLLLKKDFWVALIDVPILTSAIYFVGCILALTAILAIWYFLLVSFGIALRELVAPIGFSLIVFLGFALIGAAAPDFFDTEYYRVIFFLIFAAYEVWRVVYLGQREEEWDDDVEFRLDDIKDRFRRK